MTNLDAEPIVSAPSDDSASPSKRVNLPVKGLRPIRLRRLQESIESVTRKLSRLPTLVRPSALSPALEARDRVARAAGERLSNLLDSATEFFHRENRRAVARDTQVYEHERDLPKKWGGDAISHPVAAWILQYRSGSSGAIASGNTLGKAIANAPEGDPLSLLRDKTLRCAKTSKGKLRRDAVEYVARMRGVDVEAVYRDAVNNPEAPRSLRNCGKARSEHALNAE